MKKLLEKILSALLVMIMVIGSFMPYISARAEVPNGPTDYEFAGKWIWSSDAREPGQWISLRKTFKLDQVNEKTEARIAVDSKYWLWVNGDMVIFEGGVKTGPNRSDMYFDVVDIGPYLEEGINTIAVQAVYFGKSGYGFKDSGKQGFLFDADLGGGERLISDESWKAVKDPAYKQHEMSPNYRLAEPNIKYDVNSEMTGWQGSDFDDSDWSNAVVQANAGDAPFNQLWERPIPQLKVDDVVIYTEDGSNNTETWTAEDTGESSNDSFTPLDLPEEYQVNLEFMVEPVDSGSGYAPYGGGMGLAVNMQNADNFYMPQVSMTNFNGAATADYANYKPHIRKNGQWEVNGLYDIREVIPDDKRFNEMHSMSVSVDAGGFDAVVDGAQMERVNVTGLSGGSIGFRNDHLEKVRIYSLEVKSADGNETLFKDNFQESNLGKRMTQFSKVAGDVAPEIKEDEDGVRYLLQTNSVIMAGDVELGESTTRYTIRNTTNLQGTPYAKVRAVKGQRIDMYTDTWRDINGDSIRHAYITKDGVQEFEMLGWFNGYDVYFEMPNTVEVIELGFRPSTYNTEPAGSFVSEDDRLNLLYQKSYDTLLVTMRDNYMDCPDRERAQWWGDAVNEMQMAFYSMDANAGLLYKKTLNQTLGWINSEGRLPTTAPNGIDAISELPMQALAGVMSFWQYYMYSGDSQPMDDGYEILLNYLKLWDVDSNQLITHRGGTWDWMDWGNNPDGKIIEQCWYYIASENVIRIAQELGKPEEDISFLTERMEGIKDVFDATFWDEGRQAYYYSTGSRKADDRANALAVYSGLAKESRYEGIAELMQVQMESSPYMEKYALEAMYMMGLDDLAMERTKTRYEQMIDDEFPTLWEFWDKGAGTRNHAWTGGPLTMMYMFNAGITPLSPAYKDIQIRPLTAGLKDIKAKVPSPQGDIEVTILDEDTRFNLDVSIPAGSDSADVHVPRIEGTASQILLGNEVIYSGGKAAADLPDGVEYKGEDERFVAFTVPAGQYQFSSQEDIPDPQAAYKVTFEADGEGTITAGGQTITEFPYEVEVTAGDTIDFTAQAAAGWELKQITGSYPEKIAPAAGSDKYEKIYTVDRNIHVKAVFAEKDKEKYTLSVAADGHDYAASLLVNGEKKALPYAGRFFEGDEVELEAVIQSPLNYSFKKWTGVSGAQGKSVKVVMGAEDKDVSFELKEFEKKLTGVTVIRADNGEGAASWNMANLVDGIRISTDASNGFTSTIYRDQKDISGNPHNIILDLGPGRTFNQIAMFPRSNASAAGKNNSAAFPESFTISVSDDNKNYRVVKSIVDLPNPQFAQQVFDFNEQTARYVKITTTKLGAPAVDEGYAGNYRVQLAEIEFYNNSLVTDVFGIISAKPEKNLLEWEEETQLDVKLLAHSGAELDTATADIAFESSDTKVIDVDQNGKISAKDKGSAKVIVTATMDGLTVQKEVKITVKEKKVLLPELQTKTSESVILKSVAGYEYAISEKGQNLKFVDNPVFANLKPNTTYQFCQRIKATDKHAAGTPSSMISVLTENAKYEETKVSKVALKQKKLTLKPGESASLTADVQPSNATTKLLIYSSNSSDVTVDDNGKVTAVRDGKAKITVSSVNGITDTCEITVVSPKAKITLSDKKLTLGKGEKFTLKAKAENAGTLKFKSSNSKILSVSSKGALKAKKTGKAKITVTGSKGGQAVCTVTVKSAPKSIKLNATKKTIKKGKTYKLKVKYSKGSAGKVKYSSKNKKIATVDQNGKIKAKKRGTTTITAKTYNGKTAKIKVTVK